MTDRERPAPKKTEHLQIRIPPETKREFLDACEEDRVSASEVLRRAIVDYLFKRKAPAGQPNAAAGGRVIDLVPRSLRRRRWLAAGVGGLGIALAVAMPSAADPDFGAAFRRLDVNHDGVLTEDEFALRGAAAGRYEKPAVTFPRAVIYDTPLGPVSRGRPRPEQLTSRMAEMMAMSPSTGLFVMARFDRNRDSKVSAEELEQTLRQGVAVRFEKGDADKDGALSAGELDALFAPRPRPDGVRPDSYVVEMDRQMLDLSRAAYRSFDADGDGLVTQDEAMEGQLTAMLSAYAGS